MPIVNDIVLSLVNKPRNAGHRSDEAPRDPEVPQDERYMNNIAALREKSQ